MNLKFNFLNKIVTLCIVLILGSCLPTVEIPCTKEVDATAWTGLNQAQLQADIRAIDDYLDAKSITALEDPSGLRYIVTQAGTGDGPCLESSVKVTYKGMLLTTGAVFDASANPISFGLDRLIVGWQIGFLKLNRGSQATLYIPSGLAYGTSSTGIITANSNLIFEVALLDF